MGDVSVVVIADWENEEAADAIPDVKPDTSDEEREDVAIAKVGMETEPLL